MCYRRNPSLRNKLAKTRYGPELATPINWGGAGGLEAQVTIEDQQKWDGKGSPPGAVGESGTPPTINTAD